MQTPPPTQTPLPIPTPVSKQVEVGGVSSTMIYAVLGICILLLVFCIGKWYGGGGSVVYEYDGYRALSTIYTHTDQHPIKIEVLSHSPKIMLLHDFLTAEECEILIHMGETVGFGRSTVQGKTNEISQDRTSHTRNFKRGENATVAAIEKRVTCFSGLPPEHTEPLQIVKYDPTQQYKAHYDFFVPGVVGTTEALQRGGQRHITFFCYLNDIPQEETGAHTEFPQLNLKIRPKRGMAVYWTNVLPDTTEDFRTLHSGNPPQKSIKYGLNIWVRKGPFM